VERHAWGTVRDTRGISIINSAECILFAINFPYVLNWVKLHILLMLTEAASVS
jgi:hypothetical protein